MKFRLSARLFFRVLLLTLAFYGRSGSICAAEKDDYLTAEEVEELREAQEPHLRIRVWEKLLEDRLDKARAIKDPASVKPKSTESKPDKRNTAGADKPEAVAQRKRK